MMLFVMKKCIICMLLAVSAMADELPAKECAHTETLLSNDIKPEDAALFARYFGTAAEPVAKSWDAENLVQYSSSWGRNQAGRKVLSERLLILSEDGTTMRKLSCERFEKTPERRVNFREEVYRAVVPYVFLSNLVDIVDDEEERLYVVIVNFNPQTRCLENVEQKSFLYNKLDAELIVDGQKLSFMAAPENKLRVSIEQFAPQTNSHEGTRIKEYRFKTLELLRDEWTPCNS